MGGCLAFFRFQINIPGRHSQTVVLTHCWYSYNCAWNVEITHHAPDYSLLLPVFLAKNSVICTGKQHKFQNDRANTPEMDRAALSAQSGSKRRDFNPGSVIRGIHGRWLGNKNSICSNTPGFCAVTFNVSGIGSKILVGTKLGRIDKETDNNPFCQFSAVPD